MKKGRKSTPKSLVQTAKAHLTRTQRRVFADGTFSLNRAPGHVQDLFPAISPKRTYKSVWTACRWTVAAWLVWCELRWIHLAWLPCPGGQARCSEEKLQKCRSPWGVSSQGRVRALPHATEHGSVMRCTIQCGEKWETSELLTPTWKHKMGTKEKAKP